MLIVIHKKTPNETKLVFKIFKTSLPDVLTCLINHDHQNFFKKNLLKCQIKNYKQ